MKPKSFVVGLFDILKLMSKSNIKVASAVLDWAKDNGASVYCHWFQPLASSNGRHGLTAQVQNHMFHFDTQGEPLWKFKGENLLQGETDGSSYMTGGLRATHQAGAYLLLDPSSPIFLRGDTMFIPSCMMSYLGHALDEKTPLLRAAAALSREGKRLLGHLGVAVSLCIGGLFLFRSVFLSISLLNILMS